MKSSFAFDGTVDDALWTSPNAKFPYISREIKGCARALLTSELGGIISAERDYAGLYGGSKIAEEKKEIIHHFNDSPRISCRNCARFLDTKLRYEAAEQVSK